MPGAPAVRTASPTELDELGRIKAEVVLFDMEVLGPLQSLIRGNVPRHPLRRNDLLRERIDSLLQRGSAEAVDEAQQYADYVDALNGLVEKIAGHS